jgi:16S rRNA (guanine966-N2)-methyltransferase
MRISGGLARGIPLLAPRGKAVRPATDSLRQAVFSSLAARVVGARFLDLFAGSGAYGLEALSRGATGGLFVERDAGAVACLRRNLAAVCKSLGRDEQNLGVLQRDALTAPFDTGAPPDLIFIDPPYDIIGTIAPALFTRLAQALAPGSDALVVFELPGEADLTPQGWTQVKRLGKGRRHPTAAFFRKDGA